MISINRTQDCCGCTACEQACGMQAITMRYDKKGFLYPQINNEKCNKCNICNKICPIQNERPARTPIHTYALKNKNLQTRLNSSSGGIFSILATNTINNGGVVFGASFDEKWDVVHTHIVSLNKLYKLQGSKYVQSNLKDTFQQVKAFLDNNTPVLFSGTPCQVAGLLNYLKKKYDNLTTVDFVCHGVPSPKIWKDYLKEILPKKLTDSKHTTADPLSYIKKINFRGKPNGWIKFHLVISAVDDISKENQNTHSILINDYVWDNDYMLSFLNDYINRPSCHECHFRNGKSGSDYTIADYWGIDKSHPDFFDDNGVSLFLSYNGDIPKYIKEQTDNIETSFEDACYGNRCISSSWPFKSSSKAFYFFHQYLGYNIHNSLKSTILYEKFENIFIIFKKKTTRAIKSIWPKSAY